jgi:hypothetical protein
MSVFTDAVMAVSSRLVCALFEATTVLPELLASLEALFIGVGLLVLAELVLAWSLGAVVVADPFWLTVFASLGEHAASATASGSIAIKGMRKFILIVVSCVGGGGQRPS